jgi:hypothetical protein
MMSTKYVYRKMQEVAENHQVKVSVPVDLVRDYWKLKHGDKVIVEVDEGTLIYSVRPMKKK